MSTEKKTKKYVLALAAYSKFQDQKETLPKREFRKLVVEEMKSTMNIENVGTVGMYFSWAEKQITGRPAKVYSRGDGSRARKGDRVDEKTNAELKRLSNSFPSVSRKAAKKVDGAGFTPSGFGSASM
jgi:hypothetical protein